MLLVCGRPEPLGPAHSKDWRICGDPIQHPSDPRLQAIPYPLYASTYLSISVSGALNVATTADESTQVQVRGNLLECERAGSMIFKCVPGLL